MLPLKSIGFEKVIHDQTSSFLNFSRFLCTYQSGFRKKHITDFCFSYMTKFFDKGIVSKWFSMIVKRPFTQLAMTYFCKMSYATGFAKHAVIYFKSYLSNMSFLVNLGYFLNLYPLTAMYTKVLCWGHFCF